jgi:hypothetical protein
VREICTLGSVRGEVESAPWQPYSGTKLETADTDKARLQRTFGLLYSENRCRLRSTQERSSIPGDDNDIAPDI